MLYTTTGYVYVRMSLKKGFNLLTSNYFDKLINVIKVHFPITKAKKRRSNINHTKESQNQYLDYSWDVKKQKWTVSAVVFNQNLNNTKSGLGPVLADTSRK